MGKQIDPMIFSQATIAANANGDDAALTVELSITVPLSIDDKHKPLVTLLRELEVLIRDEATDAPMVDVVRAILRWRESDTAVSVNPSGGGK